MFTDLTELVRICSDDAGLNLKEKRVILFTDGIL